MIRTIIIGDVHGCAEELEELLTKLAPVRGDQVVFLGDLVDKGPSSARVVKHVRYLVESLGAQVVAGNHEDIHVRFAKHARREQEMGIPNPMKSSPARRAISETLDDGDLAFLEALPAFLSLVEHRILCVHGGILPSQVVLPPAKPMLRHPCLRVRFVNPAGKMVALGSETAADVRWEERYDGRSGHAVYGHEPWMQAEPRAWPHATGIDLGCAFGGWLCAMVLRPGRPAAEATFVTVKARATYAPRHVEE